MNDDIKSNYASLIRWIGLPLPEWMGEPALIPFEPEILDEFPRLREIAEKPIAPVIDLTTKLPIGGTHE